MKIKHREMHREEIKRIMWRTLDWSYAQIYGIVATTSCFLFAGCQILFTHGSEAMDGAMLFWFFGLVTLIAYFIGLWTAKKLDMPIPSKRSQLGVVIFSGITSIALSYSDYYIFLALIGVFAYATQYYYRQPKEYWRVQFFRVAREYFRETQNWQVIPDKKNIC